MPCAANFLSNAIYGTGYTDWHPITTEIPEIPKGISGKYYEYITARVQTAYYTLN